MKSLNTLLTSIILVIVSLTFSAASYAADPIETGAFNNKAIYGYDTVAYFTQNQAVEGSDNITSEWRGATWHFASAEHKALFDANPVQYAPQYGGHCSYAMSRGRFVGVDEQAFEVYKGKLYLNYSKGVQEDWQEDRDGFIADADKAYGAEFNF